MTAVDVKLEHLKFAILYASLVKKHRLTAIVAFVDSHFLAVDGGFGCL